MVTRRELATDWGLRVGTAAAAIASASPLATMIERGSVQGAYLVPLFAAVLVLVRPHLGAWCLLASSAMLSWTFGDVVLALAVTALVVRGLQPRSVGMALGWALPVIVLATELRDHPTGLRYPEHLMRELLPLAAPTLGTAWLSRAPSAESRRLGLSEAALHGLIGVAAVAALTGSVSLDASIDRAYASEYVCIGQRAAAHGLLDCDVLAYGFLVSPWPALALLGGALVLFERRKTAALFVALVASSLLFAPEWGRTAILGEPVPFFPGPGVSTCVRWAHAVDHLQWPLRALIVAAWLPWIAGACRVLRGGVLDQPSASSVAATTIPS